MKFHKQKFLHDPDNSVYGDCHRTAIACLLDLDPDDVPHFLHDGCDAKEFERRENDFLERLGYSMFRMAYSCALEDALSSVGSCNPGVIHLLAGKSPRGACHTVICCDGRIIHDPHPDGSGVVAPCGEDGFYWFSVLIPISMTRKSGNCRAAT